MADQEALDYATQNLRSHRISSLEKAGGTYDRIAKELCAIGLSNIKDYFDVAEGGELTLKPFKKLTKVKASAVKKISEKTVITESKDGNQIYKTSTVTLELHDKLRSLDMILEQRGEKEPQKIEHTGLNGGPIEFSRLDRANRIAAIAEEARRRKEAKQ